MGSSAAVPGAAASSVHQEWRDQAQNPALFRGRRELSRGFTPEWFPMNLLIRDTSGYRSLPMVSAAWLTPSEMQPGPSKDRSPW